MKKIESSDESKIKQEVTHFHKVKSLFLCIFIYCLQINSVLKDVKHHYVDAEVKSIKIHQLNLDVTKK